jgi:L-aminopeptidase/D-esterase-like protein
MQLNELGVFETPIALTTTLSVGTVVMAQVRAAIAAHPALARTTTTVNPLVFECNDGYLNDVQALAIGEAHYAQALAAATADFARGAVGAGRGMSCFGLKGGIGSASRVVRVHDHSWTLGALVLANFGRLETMTLAGRPARRDARLAARRTRAPRHRATRSRLDHRRHRHRRAARPSPIASRRDARGRRHRPHRLVLWSRQRRHRARLFDRGNVAALRSRGRAHGCAY